jgi:NAD(P)-dependent dehydrogenase (short-subunit alcohol dehydrogenase family)
MMVETGPTLLERCRVNHQGSSSMAFNGRSTADEVLAGLDLTGKTVVVTGASAGLGYETARAMAAKGATIVMAGRDPSKTAAAAHRIRTGQPGAKLATVTVDLADLDSVRRGSGEILAAHPNIHALINNAGIMGGPHILTKDGLELHFASNHVGHFLLTNLLVPALKAAAPSRVVCLTSAGHRMEGFDLDDLNFRDREYIYYLAYAQSKRANVLHAVALAKRLSAFGIAANAVHPGAIRTEVWRDLAEEHIEQAMAWSSASGSPEKTPAQGAATQVWAAVSPEAEGLTGVYLEDCHVAEHIPYGDFGAAGVIEEVLDPDTAERLWAESERVVGQSFVF